MKLKERIKPYSQAVPKLLLFQFVSFICLSLVTWVLSALFNLLLDLSGKAAITSGNLSFIFTHWQGYVMILLILMLVICYIAVELNAQIIYGAKLIQGENPSVWKSIKDGFVAMKKYLSLRGVVIILYAVIIFPIIGIGFSISLTETFYIPRFIMSVILATPIFSIAYYIVLGVLAVVAIIYCFIVHGALLDNMTLKEAGKNSRMLMKKNWKNFLVEIIIFTLISLAIAVLLVGVCSILPLLIMALLPVGTASLFGTIFFTVLMVFLLGIVSMMSVSFLLIKMTALYKKYSSEDGWSYQEREKKHHPVVITLAALLLVLCIGVSAFYVTNFDKYFPAESKTEIIAHRAGGNEAPENTVKGINVAAEYGAMGCEIDIQRTKDGYYVVNHDADFERVAGVSKTPEEMTLAEVKELKVEGEPIPTLEEMLDASRDKVILFVELKGATADNQMVDDAVRIIKEKGMEDQAVLISLKYDILEYSEEKYPEMLTGFLSFVSLGQIENTPFDYLALEEEISTDETIEAVHAKDKKIMVWTVNEEANIEEFMNSEADAIITDSVKLSAEIKERLAKRSPLELVLHKAASLIR